MKFFPVHGKKAMWQGFFYGQSLKNMIKYILEFYRNKKQKKAMQVADCEETWEDAEAD